jgi:hypothetical protein
VVETDKPPVNLAVERSVSTLAELLLLAFELSTATHRGDCVAVTLAGGVVFGRPKWLGLQETRGWGCRRPTTWPVMWKGRTCFARRLKPILCRARPPGPASDTFMNETATIASAAR